LGKSYKMKEGFYNVLKGKFLISDDAMKNWRFILFCTLLAIIMIACSHSAERKVHLIAKMNNEVRELRSESIEAQKNLMQLKMKSAIEKRMQGTGIGPSSTPPQKIRIKL